MKHIEKSSQRKQKKASAAASQNRSAKRLFIGSIFILFAAVICLIASLWVQHDTSNNLRVTQPFAGYSSGTPISMGSVTTELISTATERGTGLFEAPPGKEYIVPTLRIRNNSEKPIQVLPSLDMYVKNSSGKVSYLTPNKLTEPFRAGELLPGEQIEGQLSFLVRKGDVSKLYIDAGWSGGVLVFKL